MRAKVVPRGEMQQVYGVEVKSFPYAFIIPRHGQVPRYAAYAAEACAARPAALPGGKSAKFIEVKADIPPR